MHSRTFQELPESSYSRQSRCASSLLRLAARYRQPARVRIRNAPVTHANFSGACAQSPRHRNVPELYIGSAHPLRRCSSRRSLPYRDMKIRAAAKSRSDPLRTKSGGSRDTPPPSDQFPHSVPASGPRMCDGSLAAPPRFALLKERRHTFTEVGSLPNLCVLLDRLLDLRVKLSRNESVYQFLSQSERCRTILHKLCREFPATTDQSLPFHYLIDQA